MTFSVREIIDALHRHTNVLLYGPPGTGKSHLMKEVARHFEEQTDSSNIKKVLIDTCEERTPFTEQAKVGCATRWVTFHQGYSYEDFILGMRPIAAPGGGFSIQPRPGVLLELAAEASQGGIGLLLVDEINRGNTSRIFGEFITLMEQDKRLSAQGEYTDTTVTITLPYLAPKEVVEVETSNGAEKIYREFAMPARVYTLASMNSVDKSVSPLDIALRRRFHVINLAPSEKAIIEAVGLSATISLSDIASSSSQWELASLTSQEAAILGAALLIKLNRSIGLYLGSDFMLGQWYLPPLNNLSASEAKAFLAEAWLYRILPQLIELFHSRDEQLVVLLGIGLGKGVGSGINLIEPSADESEYGASSYIEMSGVAPQESEVLSYLLQLAGFSEAKDSTF
nr:AAA family ATPase [Pseudomonas viridiflava]